jgi:hypothetical protein
VALLLEGAVIGAQTQRSKKQEEQGQQRSQELTQRREELERQKQAYKTELAARTQQREERRQQVKQEREKQRKETTAATVGGNGVIEGKQQGGDVTATKGTHGKKIEQTEQQTLRLSDGEYEKFLERRKRGTNHARRMAQAQTKPLVEKHRQELQELLEAELLAETLAESRGARDEPGTVYSR